MVSSNQLGQDRLKCPRLGLARRSPQDDSATIDRPPNPSLDPPNSTPTTGLRIGAALRLFILTTMAMVAFAANSILCRLALRDTGIDPFGFTAIRLGSGALMLVLLMQIRAIRQRQKLSPLSAGSWAAAFCLFAYAFAFSFAYVDLNAATGPILAFGAVQATMILAGIRSGERPPAREWLGFALAIGGVTYLVFPGVTAPALGPAICMATAGLAWGFYSLLGQRGDDPALATTGNFVRTVPMVLLLQPLFFAELRLPATGVMLAVCSGALTSALGYVIWYAVLGHLTATRAALVQCTAPVIAAVGAVVFLSEIITPRLVLAGVSVVGGVALATAGRKSN